MTACRSRVLVVACGIGAIAPSVVMAAPLLRSAEARIAFESPTACRVELTVAVDGAAEVEHRVELADGSQVALTELRGATPVANPRDIGPTRALVVRPEAGAYTLRYTVRQPPVRAGRCPLWIPAVPADGRTQAVRLAVSIPADATAAGTLPAFTWSGTEGLATLGHLPAFVRVPYAPPGGAAPWGMARVMDALAILTLCAATAIWALARRGRLH